MAAAFRLSLVWTTMGTSNQTSTLSGRASRYPAMSVCSPQCLCAAVLLFLCSAAFMSHCGISGNAQADILAKESAREEQNSNNVSFSEKKTLIRALTMPGSQRGYHPLSREQQGVLVRLRTRHNRLNSHRHRKLKLASSPTCLCGQEDQTIKHVLQRCPLHKITREDVWPVSTPLTTKLDLRLQAGAGEDDIIHLRAALIV